MESDGWEHPSLPDRPDAGRGQRRFPGALKTPPTESQILDNPLRGREENEGEEVRQGPGSSPSGSDGCFSPNYEPVTTTFRPAVDAGGAFEPKSMTRFTVTCDVPEPVIDIGSV